MAAEPDDAQTDDEQPGDAQEPPDISGWLAGATTSTCPACGASGAIMLGGGVFCPTCGETSTNPGYAPPSGSDGR